MTLTLRSTSTLELNLVAVTSLRSLGSTAPTATPGVSTSSGGAIKIAACTKNPFVSLSVEGGGLYPAKKRFLTRRWQQQAFNYVANTLTICCSRLPQQSTAGEDNGDGEEAEETSLTSKQSFSNLGTLSANRSTKLGVNTTDPNLSSLNP